MLKILVTYAVQGEFVEIKWPDVEPYYIRTGIGKVKSAFHLAEAIRQVQPDLVLNLGSAGTVNHQVGDIFVCRKFIDRDMQKLAGLGLECEIDSSALLETKGFCKHWTEEGICNTGDGFLTELTHVSGDVVDMEAYAQAFVCRSKERGRLVQVLVRRGKQPLPSSRRRVGRPIPDNGSPRCTRSNLRADQGGTVEACFRP